MRQENVEKEIFMGTEASITMGMKAGKGVSWPTIRHM